MNGQRSDVRGTSCGRLVASIPHPPDVHLDTYTSHVQPQQVHHGAFLEIQIERINLTLRPSPGAQSIAQGPKALALSICPRAALDRLAILKLRGMYTVEVHTVIISYDYVIAELQHHTLSVCREAYLDIITSRPCLDHMMEIESPDSMLKRLSNPRLSR